MFLDEANPIFKEFIAQPVAFLGGVASGLLRLKLGDDPVKSWLDRQTGQPASADSTASTSNGKSNAPASITIE